MTISTRTTLTAALAAALEASLRTAGARLDLGQRVFIGAVQPQDEDAPCIVLVPGAETPADGSGLAGHVAISYTVAGFVNRVDTQYLEYAADPAATFAIIDAMIADLRAAIELACGLPTYALVYEGATPTYSVDGGELVSAELRYTITTPYNEYIPGN